MNNKILYFHVNPVLKEIFYVGIGNLNRAYTNQSRGAYWKNYVKKHGNPQVDIVFDNLSWEEAVNWEKFYIKLLGRKDSGYGVLVNLTDGGEGVLGYKPLREAVERVRQQNIGQKWTEEWRKNRAEAVLRTPHFGKHIVSEEQRERMKISNRGKGSQSQKYKLSQWHSENKWKAKAFSEHCKQQKGERHPRITKYIDNSNGEIIIGLSGVAEYLKMPRAKIANYFNGKNKDGSPRLNPTSIRKLAK